MKLWNGDFLENATLESLGLIINLAHSSDICPVSSETQRIFVIDVSGYHHVRVRFCACSHTSFLEPFRQLLRVRWYPASTLQPKTVFTFDLLDAYHKISLQGKLNLYNFYTAIMQRTDNCGHAKVNVCGGRQVALVIWLTPVDSTGIMRCRAASGSGVISRTSKGVQPDMLLSRSMTSGMGLSQWSAQHVCIQDGTYPWSGRMNLEIERMFPSLFTL